MTDIRGKDQIGYMNFEVNLKPWEQMKSTSFYKNGVDGQKGLELEP